MHFRRDIRLTFLFTESQGKEVRRGAGKRQRNPARHRNKTRRRQASIANARTEAENHHRRPIPSPKGLRRTEKAMRSNMGPKARRRTSKMERTAATGQPALLPQFPPPPTTYRLLHDNTHPPTDNDPRRPGIPTRLPLHKPSILNAPAPHGPPGRRQLTIPKTQLVLRPIVSIPRHPPPLVPSSLGQQQKQQPNHHGDPDYALRR